MQPSQEFAQGLLQQLRAVAADAQLQHLAAVLLEARQGGWQVQPSQVQVLLQAMLRKQADELQDATQHRPAYGQDVQQQEQPLVLGHVVRSAQGCSCGGSFNSGDSNSSRQVDLSRSSNEADSRLYGLANHRLKGWVTSAAAAAAWCDVMCVVQLQLAVDVYSSVVEWLPAEQQGAVEAHLQALTASYRACGGASSGDSRGRFVGTTGNQGFDSRMGSIQVGHASRQQAAQRLAS